MEWTLRSGKGFVMYESVCTYKSRPSPDPVNRSTMCYLASRESTTLYYVRYYVLYYVLAMTEDLFS
jgi:hypothetical protein